MTDEILLLSLFSGSFLSSTLLPGNSEVLLVTLLLSSNIAPALLIIVATIGNTLGGVTNVIIGRFASEIKPHKGLKFAFPWLERYGSFALLLSWLPVIGDLLCLLAGWLKLPWLSVSLCILIGKLFRYLILAIITLHSLS